MRLLIALLIGLALGGAIGFTLASNLARSGAAGLPSGAFDMSACAARIERTIAFTAPDAQDVLTVQSSGPSCANLIANVTVRTAEGHVVFAHAQRIDALMDPKLNPVAVNGVRAVLADYAAVADGGARAALPEWADGAPDIGAFAPYGMFTPTAGNMLYRRIRDSNAPLLRLREGRESGAFFAYLPEIDEVEQVARYAL
jgi:hypothetical protein